MKVILTQEVPGLGTPGDVVEVKDGYGRNYLVPQGLAILATRGAERQVAEIRRAREAKESRELADARSAQQQLSNITVQLPAKAGASGKLFGAVTQAAVAEAIVASGGPALDRRRIELASPIRALGRHQVQVKLHHAITVPVTVEVVAR